MKVFFKNFKKNLFIFFKDPLKNLEIEPQIKKALYEMNFTKLTPIQKKALPNGIKNRDIIGQAQTGTGKTAAFLTIIFSGLMKKKAAHKNPRALILAPTRELVAQIYKEALKIGAYTNIETAYFYGGEYCSIQRTSLKKNPAVIVATPGRLLAFIQDKTVFLKNIEIFVIDEADRMLDMGFMPDVRRIERAIPPKEKRQTLFFSATLPKKVTAFALSWTKNPKEIRINPENITSGNILQKIYLVTSEEKFPILLNFLKKKKAKNCIIFTNQKYVAEKIYKQLIRYKINCRLLTGDIPQNKRLRALGDFQKGRADVMIATDVAARGLHIENVSHVINYNIPNKAENYVHRIGRTGRAGKKGKSISFACQEDSFYIPAIEKYTDSKFQCEYPPEEWLKLPPLPAPARESVKKAKKLSSKHKKKKPRTSAIKNKKIKTSPRTKKIPVRQFPKTVYENGKMYRVDPEKA